MCQEEVELLPFENDWGIEYECDVWGDAVVGVLFEAPELIDASVAAFQSVRAICL